MASFPAKRGIIIGLLICTSLLVGISSLLIFTSHNVHTPTLRTSLGDVTGTRKRIENKPIEVFYGIPYAQPPVGELRFKPPVPQEPWSGTKDATQKPNSCWQEIDEAFDRFPGVEMWNPNTARSEDCLYLNVWRPSCSVGCNEPKPIMVWIYGGGFYSGSTTLDVYDGSYLSAYKDVIVVSIAYRLGVLGFMFSDSNDAPGNMGLLDQNMALRWVKDNAVNLGGSPDDITLFGESAGAISVGYHLLSPLSRDLFTYAIMESASPLFELPAGKKEAALNKTIIIADILSCPTDPPAAMMTCLREIDPQTITKKQWELERFYPGIPFWPLVDGYFLPDEPALMIQRGDVKNTSVIIGVNANEGTYFFVYLFMKYFPIHGDGQITERQYDEILHEIFSGDSSKISQVKKEYSREPGLSYTARLDAIYGDKRFKCPVVDFAREYAKVGGKVYLYSFEHRVSTNPWPEWLGVAHGYEIEIVFGLPLAPSSKYTDQERELSLRVMEFWTNLAKTGNPNNLSETIWPPYTTADQHYVIIDSEGTRIARSLRQQQCALLSRM